MAMMITIDMWVVVLMVLTIIAAFVLGCIQGAAYMSGRRFRGGKR
jgi:hypothetical protein